MKNTNSSIIVAKFKRSKLNLNKTKLWEMLDPSLQQLILYKINLSDNEQEIICFYNYDYWYLITNKNLIIFDNERILYIKLIEILNINVPAFIKSINSTEVFLDIFYQDKEIKLIIEKSSWPIIIEILKLVTEAKINMN